MKKLILALFLLAAPAFATVYNTAPRATFTASGVGTLYAFTFPVASKTEVQVLINGVVQVAGITVAINSDQSASPGGTVTFSTAPLVGQVITLQRRKQLIQTTSLPPYSPFPAKTVERTFDGQVQMIQQVNQDLIDLGSTLSAKETADISAVISGGAGAANLIAPVDTGSNTARTLAARFADVTNVKSFGATGDGVTDDAAAIQAAIDYAIYIGKTGVVFMPSGNYKISTTLHLGYGAPYNGQSFTTVRLTGAQRKYRGDTSFAGTTILPTFSDRPAINVQGARGTQIENISIAGLNTVIQSAGVGNGIGNGIDETLGSSWVTGGLAANADSASAPYAGIAIDGYSGTAPGTAYPAVTYPGFMGSPGQYSKAFSNVVTLRNVYITGFIVGLVTQPSGTADGNGDFIVIFDSHFEFNKYHVSIGQTQARQFQCYNCRLDNAFIAFTNDKHGKLTGATHALFSGCSFDRVQSILDVVTAYSGPITFQSCYGELVGSIGTIGTNTTNNSPVRFTGSEFHFGKGDDKAVPLNLLATTGLGAQIVDFSDSTLMVGRTFTWSGGVDGVVFNNTFIRPQDANIPVDTASRLAQNAMRGIFPELLYPFSEFPEFKIRTYQSTNVSSPSNNGIFEKVPFRVPSGEPRAISGRNYPLPAWMSKGTWLSTEYHGIGGYDITRGSPNLTGVSWSGIDVSFVLSSRTAGSDAEMWIGAGDLVYDDTTEARYFVKSVSGTTITLELLSSYTISGGIYSTTVTLPATSGHLYVFCSRIYAVPYPTFADATSGSGVLANAGRLDGYFGYNSVFAIGDYVLSFANVLQNGQFGGQASIFPSATQISAIGANSITLNKNATRTITGQPFTFWIRAP